MKCKRCMKEIKKGNKKRIYNEIICEQCYDKIAHDYLQAFWRGEVN